jgi:hypothetical protein
MVVNATPQPLYSRETEPIPTLQEVWTEWRIGNQRSWPICVGWFGDATKTLILVADLPDDIQTGNFPYQNQKPYRLN